MPPAPLPNFMGYAEVRHGAEVVPRVYLLKPDLDATGDGLAVPNAGTAIKVAASSAEPELVIQLLAAIGVPDTRTQRITIRIDRPAGRPLSDMSIRVFVMASIIGNFPVPAASELLRPLTWFHAGYRCPAGNMVPSHLVIRLGQRVDASTGPTNDVIEASIEVEQTVATPQPPRYPLDLSVGQFSGPALKKPAILTTFPGGVYTETTPAAPAVLLDETNATSRMSGDLRITEPGAQAIQLGGRVFAHITVPRSGPSPTWARPTAVPATGPGNVTPGGHRYKMTYLHSNGNESGATLASEVVKVPQSGAKVKVGGLPKVADIATQRGASWDKDLLGGADAGLAVKARRVYRTKASPSGDEGPYFLVHTFNEPAQAGEVDFKDDVPDTQLGDAAHPALGSKLHVHYHAAKRFDIEGTVVLHDATGTDEFVVRELRGAPTSMHIDFSVAPDGTSKVTVESAAPLPVAEATGRLSSEGTTDHVRLRAEALPAKANVRWRMLPTRMLVEVSSGTGEPIGAGGFWQSPVAIPLDRPVVAPQAICAEIVSTAGAASGSRLRVSARDLIRARFAIGEKGPVHARDDDGITAEVRFGPLPEPPPRGIRTRARRSLRALWIDESASPSQRLWLRIAALPDDVKADLRLPSKADPRLGGHIGGGAHGVKGVYVRSPRADDPWTSVPGGMRVRFALPELGPDVDVVRDVALTGGVPDATDDGVVTATLRTERTPVEAAVRTPLGFSGLWWLANIQAAAVLPAIMVADLRTPEVSGITPGVSAHVSTSEPSQHPVAVRANPQVRLRAGGIDGPAALGARVLSIDAASVRAPEDKPLDVRAAFTPQRGNSSFRGSAEERDILTPNAPAGAMREIGDGRTELLPDKLRVLAGHPFAGWDEYALEMSAAAGKGEFRIEPTVRRTYGPYKGTIAGIGLAEGSFTLIPKLFKATLMGDDAHPNFYDLPDGWVGGGLALAGSQDFSLVIERLVAWSRDDLTFSYWSKTQIPKFDYRVRFGTPTTLSDLGGVTLWMPAERPPSDPEKPSTGIAWQALDELDLWVSALEVGNAPFAPHWSTLGAFTLTSEFQLKQYRGAHVIANDGFPPTADTGPGGDSGKYWIRSVDGISLPGGISLGDAYFGNTGGGPFPWDIKPRIYP